MNNWLQSLQRILRVVGVGLVLLSPIAAGLLLVPQQAGAEWDDDDDSTTPPPPDPATTWGTDMQKIADPMLEGKAKDQDASCVGEKCGSTQSVCAAAGGTTNFECSTCDITCTNSGAGSNCPGDCAFHFSFTVKIQMGASGSLAGLGSASASTELEMSVSVDLDTHHRQEARLLVKDTPGNGTDPAVTILKFTNHLAVEVSMSYASAASAGIPGLGEVGASSGYSFSSKFETNLGPYCAENSLTCDSSELRQKEAIQAF